MGVGHVMWCDTCHIHNEMPVVSPGLGGHKDGSGTEGGMSHNSIPPLKATPQGLGGLVCAHPSMPSSENKRQCGGGAGQDSTMPSIAELTAAVVVANDNLADLVQQQAKAKDWEEREAREATIGS